MFDSINSIDFIKLNASENDKSRKNAINRRTCS